LKFFINCGFQLPYYIGALLERTQKKINEANTELDKLVGVRTRIIQRKLKEVQE
jgi:DNA recombination protein RmuC